MSLINGLLALLGEIESDAIAVHEERRISVRNRNADYLRCVEACTSGALAYRAGELLVEPERCIGRQHVRHGVPHLRHRAARNPTDAELTAQLTPPSWRRRAIRSSCARTALEAAQYRDDDASARVRCLPGAHGRVGARGVGGVPRLRRDAGLRSVRRAHMLRAARSCARWWRARNLLEAFGSSMPIDLVECVPERVLSSAGRHGQAGSDGVGRRDFFRSAKDGIDPRSWRR